MHGPDEATWTGTDDFFMTSGFCIDVGLYDVITGLVDKKKAPMTAFSGCA